MKTIINEDLFLNRKIYKNINLENIKFEKRKTIIFKFPISILMILLVIKISILIERKEEEIKMNHIKKRREPITSKKIRPYSYKEKKETIGRAYSIDRDFNEEYKDIQEYIDMTMNGTLYNSKEVFKKIESPKISIVITVYNGEGYLKTSVLSIQNQDFKDIEIIMVDDGSKDNSVNLIKELMIKDPRIKLYRNKENKGMLYTKTRGILHSKGKYAMILDVDDIYAQRDAFSTLNLDILGYSSLISGFHMKMKNKIFKHRKTDIIYQPNIPEIMYKCNSHKCIRVGGLTSQYFFRTDLFVNVIKQVDDKYMNIKMNFYDDFLLFFLLSRKAHSLRQIKRIFYIIVRWPNERNNTLIKFRLNEKKKNRENMLCMAYINYIEFILKKSNNNIYDKMIPSFELKKHFLKHKCRYNKNIRKRAIKVLKLFLRNNYIEKEIKNEILDFLNEINKNSKSILSVQ